MNLTDAQHETLVNTCKLGSAWAAFGITAWSDAAAFFAAVYSVLLIGEFFWKRSLKQFFTGK